MSVQPTNDTDEMSRNAGDYAEDMAMEMLATTIGLPDDLGLTWDQREEQWKLSGKIYKTNNFTQSAEGRYAEIINKIEN